MKKIKRIFVCAKTLINVRLAGVLILGILLSFTAKAQVSPYSLLDNGDFESGISGTGFQVTAPYNYLAALTGNSNPGDYALITNPQPMNTAFFITTTDHSGSGKMMVVDGTTTGGQQRFWKAGSSGGGVGPLVIGQTYTFSYWVLNISTSAVNLATSANISVAWNNVSASTLVSGNQQVSYPGFSAIWEKVVYSFVPSSNYVNIELYNNNLSAAGNDFAIDDLEVLGPPIPLALTYSVINPGCAGSNDGFITVYGKGGTPPYTYSLNGGAYTTNPVFSGLSASVNNIVSVKDAATPTPATVSSTASINVIAPVSPVTIRTDTTICSGASVTLFSGGASTYNWAASPADPTLTNPNAQNPIVSPTATTLYTLTGHNTTTRDLIYNGNFSGGDSGFYSDYVFMNTNASGMQRTYGILANPNDFEPGFSAACVDHTSGTGRMMVVDGSTIANQKLWCQTVAVTPGVTYNFSYWLQTVANPSPASIEVMVNGSPITGSSATSTGIASAVCAWTQFSYTWNSNANTTAEICLYNRNTTAAGNDFAIDDISFTSTPICSDQKSVTVTVNPSGTPITGFSYLTPICANSSNPIPTTVAGFTTGGIFSSTAGLVINATTGEVDLAASTPGSYTVTYSITASGCNPAASSTGGITITPNTFPVTGFSYVTPVCATAGLITPTIASGFTTGGTYASTPGLVIDANTGVINANTSTPGLYTVTYSVPALGCRAAGTSTTAITIQTSATPVTGFSYPSPVCAASGNQSPTLNAGFAAGGTFTSTAGLSIDPPTGQISAGGSTPGTYTITYTVAASGCTAAGSSNASITILASGTAVTGFSYTTPLCTNAGNTSPALNAGFTTGGTFSAGAGLSINASTGVVNTLTSTPGSYTITYAVAATTCTAAASSTANLVISAAVTPGTSFSYTTPVCTGSGNVLPIAGAGFSAGGTYSSTAGLVINASTGEINTGTSTPGTYTITYQIAASGCQQAGSGTATITIASTIAPTTGFSYPTSVCNTGSDPAPTTVAGFITGGTFSSTAGLLINALTGVINVAASTPGNYIITYAVPASGCLSAGSSTASIAIVASTNAVTNFSYPTPVCLAAANPMPVTATGFTTGGTYSSTTGLSINPNTGQIILATSTPGTYTITYTYPTTGCVVGGSSLAGIAITANNNPVTGFSYASPICIAAANPAPVPSTGFSTGGTYSATPGLSVDAVTGVVNLAASTPGIYTVTYTYPATGCNNAGTGFANIEVVANNPVVTGFSYATPICGNATNPLPQLNTGFTAGGTFSSTPGLSVNPSTGLVNLATTTAGNYVVTYTVAANACNINSNTGTANLVVNLVPTPPATSDAARCGAGDITLRANGSGNLSWYSEAQLINQVATGNIYTPNLSVTSTFYVIDSNAFCASAATAIHAVINEVPEKPRLGRDTALCPGQSIVLNAGAYDSYLWQDGSTSSIITANSTGIYTVSVKNSGVCAALDTIAVVILENCDDIYFPKAFSPNNDGNNERFGALGNVFLVKDFSMKIFNRQGQMVYSSFNVYQRWDGTINGVAQATGNFVYVASYVYKGSKRIQKGNLVLIR